MAVVVLGVALVAAICACVLTARMLTRDHAKQAAQWAAERRELLNRIQRPDHIPVAPRPEFVMPELEPDDIGLVGTIAYPDGDDDA